MHLNMKLVVRLAKQLRITNQNTTKQSQWDINDEQVEILDALVMHQLVCVLKGRQIGSSTVCLLYLLVLAICNPGMPMCIVADTADKAKSMLGRIKGWCDQLGVQLTRRHEVSIELSNGATIDALSAVSTAEQGESRVGRSKSYFAVLASELGFWMNDEAVFRGLTATALPGARIIIESTASAADNLFRSLWNDDNEWEHVFLGLERHVAYRRNPDDISDEIWDRLRGEKYGFTRRDSASWFYHTCKNKFGGDEVGALREFPVKPEHCFANAKGRWINVFQETKTTEDGIWEKGRFSGWQWYVKGEPQEPVCFGVDTAAGHGGDSSAFCILGMLTGTIYATWCSSTTSIPDYINFVKDQAEKYQPVAIVVEFNGVGIPVYESLSQMTSFRVEKQVSGSEKHLRLQRLKQAIEEKVLPIGPELVYEAKNSRIQPPKSAKSAPEYVGRDDMLNAVSFAREFYLQQMPSSSPADLEKKVNLDRQFHLAKIIKNNKKWKS